MELLNYHHYRLAQRAKTSLKMVCISLHLCIRLPFCIHCIRYCDHSIISKIILYIRVQYKNHYFRFNAAWQLDSNFCFNAAWQLDSNFRFNAAWQLESSFCFNAAWQIDSNFCFDAAWQLDSL